jgi:hypothetical protein
MLHFATLPSLIFNDNEYFTKNMTVARAVVVFDITATVIEIELEVPTKPRPDSVIAH